MAETTFQGYVATGESCPVASCLQGNLNKAGGVFGSLLLLCWGEYLKPVLALRMK